MIKLLLSSVYSLSIPIIYVYYLNPLWEYAGYNIYRSDIFIFLIFLMTIIPMFFLRNISIASFVNFFVYILVYVPAMYINYYNIKNITYIDLFVLNLLLTLLMIFGFFVSNKKYSLRMGNLWIVNKLKVENFLVILGIIVMISVIMFYKNNMQLLNFKEIYDLRVKNSEIGKGVVGYLTMFLTYFFIPLYLSNALDKKKHFLIRVFYFVLALCASIIIYASTGAKIVIFLFVFIIFVNYLLSKTVKFYQNLLLVIVILNILFFMVPNEGIFFWIKSIYFLRSLTIGGWTMSVYYDYFTQNGFTYYSHIKFLNTIFDYYPYGELGLGQLIGIEISGTPIANFNANFIASDGIAAAGIVGILVVGIVYILLLIFLNFLSNSLEYEKLKKQSLVLMGFISSLTNLPLSTAMLSGGGLLLIIYLIFSNKGEKL